MKKHLYILAIAALVLNACGPTYVVQQRTPPPPPVVADPVPPPPPPEPEPEASYQSFYDDLSPYGQWINDPRYGYVWLPDVGPDFKPYSTNGHWVFTDEGWTWASDYQWGWATFHYGRWFFQDGYGWMWLPGNEYSPAWVTWRNSDDYYGWAPMGPGVNFDMAYGGGYMPPAHYWSFVPHQYVGSPYARNYYVNESRNVTIINHTTVINNITVVNNNNYRTRNVNYGHGPDPMEVGRYAGTTVRPVPVRMSNRPVAGGQYNNGGLSVYRPRINDAPRNNNNGNMGVPPRMAPTRVSNLNDARPQNTAIYGSRPANTGRPNRDNDPVYNRPGQQPDNRPPFGRPVNPGGQPQQPANNPPANVQQPPVQQPPVQQPPAQLERAPSRGQMLPPPSAQPGGRPAQQPAYNAPAQQPPVSQPNQPVYNRPVTQQPSNNVPVQQPPVNQPVNRPVTQQPVTQSPVTQPPAQQPPVNQPVTRPQPVMHFTPPGRSAAQPQPQQQQPASRPVFTPRPQPAPAPAAQSRPVNRPVTPPPPPQKPDDKKDNRPVRQ